jgi:hypothetical protein
MLNNPGDVQKYDNDDDDTNGNQNLNNYKNDWLLATLQPVTGKMTVTKRDNFNFNFAIRMEPAFAKVTG